MLEEEDDLMTQGVLEEDDLMVRDEIKMQYAGHGEARGGQECAAQQER